MNRLATNGEVIARTSAPYPNPKDSWLPTTIGWAVRTRRWSLLQPMMATP